MRTKMTLAQAFENIVARAKGSKLDNSLLASVKNETNYIKRKFNITPMERKSKWNSASLRRRKMIYVSCQEYMSERRGWRICKEVLNAVSNDASFEPSDPSTFTAYDVMREIRDCLDTTDNDSDYYDTMVADITNLLANTQHLEFSSQLSSFPLTMGELVMFLIAASRLVLHRIPVINSSYYEDILDESYETFDICNGINEGTGNLVKLGLMENATIDGMTEPDSFQVTERAIKTVLQEFHINLATRRAATPNNLILPEKLTPKELFYNDEEQRQVNRLMDLLSPKTFGEVQQRLKDSGMRTGFCVLLHGVPGSGKTELVNQLCIATGRPVMVAQVSELISKWVGDYEKNISELFEQYASLVAKSKVCPILLFNECDAILGKRNEQGGSDAVGKMYHSVQNILLEQMEKLNGIMICTSNMPGALDKAFERRFLFSIEFHKPQKEVKAKIWRAMMPEINKKTAQALAAQYDFSGGQIENVVRRQRVEHILYSKAITFDSLSRICKEEGYDKKTRGIGFCA